MMSLNETVTMMNSEDFKERFRAEYFQLVIRRNGLENMLQKYKLGTLTFKPSCPYELLYTQLIHMNAYLDVLKERARIENIVLTV